MFDAPVVLTFSGQVGGKQTPQGITRYIIARAFYLFSYLQQKFPVCTHQQIRKRQPSAAWMESEAEIN
jgi:hypothetical protein